jgi:hypothetical protein
MLLGAPLSALMPCLGGHADISDPVVFEVFKLDREAVLASDKSLETWSLVEAVLAPSEVEVRGVPAAGDTVSV